MKTKKFHEGDKIWFGIKDWHADGNDFNVDEYFEYASSILDTKFGEGFSEKNPTSVIQMMGTLNTTFLLHCIDYSLNSLPERIVEEIVEKLKVNLALSLK